MMKRQREMEMELETFHQVVFFSIFIFTIIMVIWTSQFDESLAPSPQPWPERFHALLYMNLTSTRLQITDLWYDWPKGRNINIIQKQLGELLYDVEWNNGTSFYYTLGANGTCETILFEVGIPRPDWLNGATYLGTDYTDGFLCNVWEKVDFISYYEDVATKRPVRWDFYDGISTHVFAYEVGSVLPDSHVQAPAYCFSQDNNKMSFDPEILVRRNIDGLLDFDLRKLTGGP